MLAVVEVLIFAFLTGGIYSLTAIGLTMIFGVSEIMNLAHGDFIMLGGMSLFILVELTGINRLILSIPLFFLFLAIGLFIQRTIFRRVTNLPPELKGGAAVMVTLGLALMIDDATSYFIGNLLNTSYFSFPRLIAVLSIFGYTIPWDELVALIGIIILGLVLDFFMTKTISGQSLRAVIESREASTAFGVNLPRFESLGTAIGISLAGLAGFILVNFSVLEAWSGASLTMTALAIIILGGMGSFLGTVLGALTIAISESLVSLYISVLWSPIIAFVLLIVILIVRPQGFLGEKIGG